MCVKVQRHVKSDNDGDDMDSQMSINTFIMDIHNWIMDIPI